LKVAVVMVAGSIASLKMALIAVLTETLVAPLAGLAEETVGGVVSDGAVVTQETSFEKTLSSLDVL
jgi:hypothetical protein